MTKNANVAEVSRKERMEEWRVRFEANGDLFKEKLNKPKPCLITEEQALILNTGRKSGCREAGIAITVMYFRKGEDLPVGGEEILKT